MADYIFDEWKKALGDFQNCVEKELDEVRRQKNEIQQLKCEIFETIQSGQFIRDDSKIIISAPEIIIGDVDKDGVLRSDVGASKVTIRANNVNLEGVGSSELGGSVVTRAASIQNIGVDPGTDGLENVVCDRSEIIMQARDIALQSNESEGIFAEPIAAGGGITLNSDRDIMINAAKGNTSLSNNLKNKKSSLKSQQSNLKKAVSDKKKEVENILKSMQQTLEERDKLNADEMDVRTNLDDIYTQHNDFQNMLPGFYSAVTEYVKLVSQLAEANREIKCIEDNEKVVSNAKSNFQKESTGAMVSINGEHVGITSSDGDGNLRENEGAGFSVRAKSMEFSAYDAKGALMKDGFFGIGAEKVEISTANPGIKDEKNADYPADGSVKITTKELDIEAVDYEEKDEKIEEKALTKDGLLNIRMEKINIASTDKDGKAAGSISMNAKELNLKSVDTDPEKHEDKEIAQGGSVILSAEKFIAGDDKAKSIQFIGDEIAVIANKTAELQQEKGIVQLDGGKLSATGSEVAIIGKTTITGATEIKGDVKAPKATIDNLEAKSSFKSTSISDGIAVPGAPASGNLSAKIKKEEKKKK